MRKLRRKTLEQVLLESPSHPSKNLFQVGQRSTKTTKAYLSITNFKSHLHPPASSLKFWPVIAAETLIHSHMWKNKAQNQTFFLLLVSPRFLEFRSCFLLGPNFRSNLFLVILNWWHMSSKLLLFIGFAWGQIPFYRLTSCW